MSSVEGSGIFRLGDVLVKRLGYGAMQLSGPGIFGPPRDRKAALAVLREAIAVDFLVAMSRVLPLRA